MNTKMKVRSMSGVLLICALSASLAQAQMPPRGAATVVGTFGVGGLTDFQLTPSGTRDAFGGGTFAQLQIRGVLEGQSTGGNTVPLLWGMGAVRGNMIGGGTYDLFGGLSANGRILVGGQLLDAGTNGCAPYFGAEVYANVDVGFRNPRTGGEIRLAPETGLMCRVDGVLFTISPSSGVGYSGYRFPGFTDRADNPHTYAQSFGFVAGGSGRMSVDNRFWLTIDAMFTPRVTADWRASDSFSTTLNMAYQFTDTPGLLVEIANEVRNYRSTVNMEAGTPTVGEERWDVTSYLIFSSTF